MTVRSLMVGALALCMVSLCWAKTYDITIPAPAKVGNVELKPGQYKLKIEGAVAVFTDSHNKSFSVPAKVETSDKKFNYTRLETANRDGMDTIQAIDLEDSNTRVTIGQ